MDGKWIKIVLFVLGIVMLAGVANVLLDPGLGKPDESRRWKHPAGFSAVAPIGWGATMFYNPSGGDEKIRLVPERSTGRQTVIHITRLGAQPAVPANVTQREITFQGQPARHWTRQIRYEWLWYVHFERGGAWYEIMLSSPIQIDVEGSQYMAYINSFRVEPTVAMPPPTSMGVIRPGPAAPTDATPATAPTLPAPMPLLPTPTPTPTH